MFYVFWVLFGVVVLGGAKKPTPSYIPYYHSCGFMTDNYPTINLSGYNSILIISAAHS